MFFDLMILIGLDMIESNSKEKEANLERRHQEMMRHNALLAKEAAEAMVLAAKEAAKTPEEKAAEKAELEYEKNRLDGWKPIHERIVSQRGISISEKDFFQTMWSAMEEYNKLYPKHKVA